MPQRSEGPIVSEQDFKKSVASHLKATRSAKNLSLDAVAKLTGVSKAMLGQIEREESSPTIAKLWQIASGLETSFSAFLVQETEPENQQYFINDPNMKVQSILPYNQIVNFEIHQVTLTHHHCQHSLAHAHGVVETIIVLNGDLDVFSDGNWHHIPQGHTFRFYADQPHGYKAVTETVIFQNIVSY
jgi:transcriptional regulator with XRE-family HTH domain